MKRLVLLALTPLFVLTTPAIAQSRAESAHEAVPYGPRQTPSEKPEPMPPQPAPTYEILEAPSIIIPVDDNRLIAAGEVAPNAMIGLGMFQIVERKRPAADR